MKTENIAVPIFMLCFAGALITLGFLLYYDAKNLAACEALGGVYVDTVCIDASAVIELTKAGAARNE